MRTLGVGSRWSVLVMGIAMLGGASACSTREAGATAGGLASGAEPANEPEQVVQNMMAKTRGDAREGNPARGNAPAGNAPSGSTRPGSDPPGSDPPGGATQPEPRSGAAASEARVSAAGVSRDNGGSLAPRIEAAETITSRHLEAELNRLEAELAN